MTRPINIARASDVLGKPKPIAPAILVDARQETLHKKGKVLRTTAIRKGAGSGMNKTEERFKREVLFEGGCFRGLFYTYESIKLRLADRTWYTPDFVVWTGAHVNVYEVKGSWKAPHQEDSRVKLKVAAELYPQFTFFAAVPNKETGGWDIEEIPCRARQ